jgi:hypothetical protein
MLLAWQESEVDRNSGRKIEGKNPLGVSKCILEDTIKAEF